MNTRETLRTGSLLLKGFAVYSMTEKESSYFGCALLDAVGAS